MSKYPRLEIRKVSSLKIHPDGIRFALKESIFNVSKSLDLFGLLRPAIVLNSTTGNLLDGDVVLEHLRSRGVEEIPVWVVQISEEMEDVAHLALNNHAGEWHWQAVSERLKAVEKAGQAIGLTGFHSSDYGPLLAADWTIPVVGPMDGSDANQASLL